jgi:hypothetical protein
MAESRICCNDKEAFSMVCNNFPFEIGNQFRMILGIFTPLSKN